MKTIGQPNEVTKPSVIISGPGGPIDIASASITYSVGQIATANVGIPPESLGQFFSGQDDIPVTIQAGEEGSGGDTLFTGFYAGPTALVSGTALRFGTRLIHTARDLDQGRTWAPFIHPMSNDDFSNYMSFSATSGLAGNGIENLRGINFDLFGNLVDEAKKTVGAALDAVVAVPKFGIDGIGADPDAIAAAKALLERIQPHGACKIDEADVGEAAAALQISAQERVIKIIWGSITSLKSVWDLMSMILSSFGLTLVCTRDGGILGMPDFSGVKPPGENFADGNLIAQANAEAAFTRNLSKTAIISYGLPMTLGGKAGPLGDAGIAEIQGNAALVAIYPEKDNQPSKGATYVTTLPSWMIPVTRSGAMPKTPRGLMQRYAQHVHNQVLHQGRAFAISGPLVPGAEPGTTMKFAPISAMKAFSGEDLPTDSTFTGYCYKVNHTIDVNARVMQTTFYLRNIYTAGEAGEQLESPALFSGDKPRIIS